VQNYAIQDVSIARQILGIMVRKLQYGGDVASFTVPAKWCLLSPMDLITVTDPLMGVNQLPVRITSMAEQTDGSIQCQAEPFVYGMYAPTPFSASQSGGSSPSTGATVTQPINPPIIFEPVPGLIGSANQGQVWLVISDPDPNFAGAQVYISTDGGASYISAGSPTIGNGVQGVTVDDWPGASSPDTTNNLSVNLTESAETLQSYPVATEDGFVYPCYVENGPPTPVLRGSSFLTQGPISNTILIPLPAGSEVGDLAILFASAGDNIAPVPETGWANAYSGGGGGPWSQISVYKLLISFDITLGYVEVQCPAGAFDMAGGLVVFVGPTGGIRETEGIGGDGGNITLTNTTSGAVLDTDVAVYWASLRQDGGPIDAPVITPSTGTANTLGGSGTTNIYALLADQVMPGGAVTVENNFVAAGNGGFAVQVIVESAATPEVPYELMTYGAATLTAVYNYTLMAIGAPATGVGVDHPNGSAFALLPPSGQGICKVPLLPAWVGETVHFKMLPFNSFGVVTGTLADATAYPYTVLGTSGTGAQTISVNGS
jgi:hypothetical protein